MNSFISRTGILILWAATVLSLITSASIRALEIEENTLRLGLHEGFVEIFPESKGIIYAHAIPYELFKMEGFKLNIVEYPARRLPISLKNDRVDLILSTEGLLGKKSDQILRSTYPTSVVTWHIYYKNDKSWEPVWPPDDMFLSKTGKSNHSSVSLKTQFGLNLTQAFGFDAVVKMVNMGRVDYWIETGIGYRSVSAGLIKSEKEGFILKGLLKRSLYVYFQNTPRGRQLLEIYNANYLKMLQRGDFALIYYKYAKNSLGSTTIEDTIELIKSINPTLIIPPQKKPTH
ncbi:hypothetical protein JYU12_00100 [bacterium AH-315-K03]|nr:hypothetical protein [bacterium AH-315-K03]